MISFLLRRLRDEKNAQQKRKKIGLLAGWITVACNAGLFLVKLLVGVATGSVAVTADAFNNLSDSGASLVTLAGFQLSNRSPNKKHPFGYGRAEYVAGLVISVLILAVGFEFVGNAIGQIMDPGTVEFRWPMLAILLAAMVIKLWLGYANFRLGKEMGGSSALSATAFDSMIDVAATLVSIASLVFSNMVAFPIDGWLGLLVALAVLVGGAKVLMDTISPLLGQPPEPEFVEDIKRRVLSYPQIVGVHDMMIHNYGPERAIVTLHAEIPADNDFVSAHEVIDRAEREISESLNITMLIHLDPIVTDDHRVNDIRRIVKECLAGISADYSMHDFRMVSGGERLNLIFDVLVPYGLSKTDEEIEQEISQQLQKLDARWNAIITIDKSYVG